MMKLINLVTNLTLEEKIRIFKTFAIFKTIQLPSYIKYIKNFFGINKRPKIREITLINNFGKGDLDIK